MRTASVATAPHGFAPWVHVELQFVLLAPKHDVRREACGSGFHHAVAEGREIQALEHRLASCEQDRRKRKVQFILGRNMFGPVRGEWLDDNWKGWCSGQWWIASAVGPAPLCVAVLSSPPSEPRSASAAVNAHGARSARAAGLIVHVGNHSFRATGITAYLNNGGTLENAQAMAAHESPRTTKLYDRTGDEITLDEVERISI